MGIHDAVRAFILRNFYIAEPDALANDASLLETGIVDSTGVLEVTAFLEETFGLRIVDVEITPENLDSIDRIARFVVRKNS